tara:strand:- start:780 stop:1385 length:606 start_codon:yes stop_codon:yes gene_type:complete
MIEFKVTKSLTSSPIEKLEKLYKKAVENNQILPQAVCISSIDIENDFVDSRFVNLKYVNNRDFIFFSNYLSKKGIQFDKSPNTQVTMVIYWNTLDIQVRIRGIIRKISSNESDKHFNKRTKQKNALSISSNQSSVIDSYESVKTKYHEALNKANLQRPQYWGGYKLKASYIEFWKGSENRLNKREVFEFLDNKIKKYYLEP